MAGRATYKNVHRRFRANARINCTISLPGRIDPSRAAGAVGGAAPHGPSVIRLWQGFVFMFDCLFGCMFWEVSRDVARNAPSITYSWIEKTVTPVVITLG